jgi:hypothetical protein
MNAAAMHHREHDASESDLAKLAVNTTPS